jgi:hypothetical protein
LAVHKASWRCTGPDKERHQHVSSHVCMRINLDQLQTKVTNLEPEENQETATGP